MTNLLYNTDISTENSSIAINATMNRGSGLFSFKSYTLKQVCLFCLLILVSFIWGRRTFASLWLDETLSWWVASSSLEQLFPRVQEYQGQSPVYFISLWFVQHSLGSSEWILRIPSLLSGLLTLGLVYLIGRHLFDSQTAWTACLLYGISDGAIFSATSARPYGMATLFATASFYSMMRYCKHKDACSIILFFISSLLAIHTHYLFIGILPIHWCYFATFCDAQRRKFAISLGILQLVILASLALHADQLSILMQHSEFISLRGSPSFSSVVAVILPIPFLLLMSIGYFVTQAMTRGHLQIDCSLKELSSRSNVFLLLWYLVPPLGLAMASLFLHSSSLFSQRYLVWNTPAFAFLLARMITVSKEQQSLKVFLLVTTLLFTLFDPFREITKEDWRHAISYANTKIAEPISKATVLFYPGLLETRNLAWVSHSRAKEYLSAPLRYYNFHGQAHVLPFSIHIPGAIDTWDTRIKPLFESDSRVVLVGSNLVRLQGMSPMNYWKHILTRDGFGSFDIQKFKETFVLTAVKLPNVPS
ncbi:MAG: glycosyltransferase family 39 protein [Bdellovibrionales bacterium]|nr:glycosyltransferase family 39 protein [Bdellovibrionales bacterium]